MLLFAAGCASASGVLWMKEDIHPVAVRGDRRLDRVRIWTHDGVLQWHTVLVTHDSISGIPDNPVQPCNTCLLTLPTSAVDSLRVGYATGGYGGHDGGKDDGTDFLLASLLILGALFCP